ncbi:MAG: nitroreductase family protein [Spirochaetales bacterium]
MNNKLFDALNTRRSRYMLSKKSTLSNEELETLLQNALKLTPSAFNSQAGKIVLLLNDNHTKLWEIVKGTLKKLVSQEQWAQTESKVNAFEKAYGTVLFFEDMDIIENLQTKFPTYKETFSIWSDEQAGMLQLSVWVSLSENNMGASLQHYNPIIDDEVKETFNLPKNWKLMAQMPFGVSLEEPAEKPKLPISERLIIKK